MSHIQSKYVLIDKSDLQNVQKWAFPSNKDY